MTPLLQDYQRLAQSIEPLTVPRIIPSDPDDDHVLACALTANADLIVSGDRKHLLPIGSYQGIRIVTPTDALQLIGSG